MSLKNGPFKGTPKDLKQAVEFGLAEGSVLGRVQERIRHDFSIVISEYRDNPDTERALWDLFHRLIPAEDDVVKNTMAVAKALKEVA